MLSKRDAKYGFGQLTDLARAEPVSVVKRGRPVVVVITADDEPLKSIETDHAILWSNTDGEAQ